MQSQDAFPGIVGAEYKIVEEIQNFRPHVCLRQVRPARRLQMARPDRAVLQTEPPPPLGASAALEAAEAAGRA